MLVTYSVWFTVQELVLEALGHHLVEVVHHEQLHIGQIQRLATDHLLPFEFIRFPCTLEHEDYKQLLLIGVAQPCTVTYYKHY